MNGNYNNINGNNNNKLSEYENDQLQSTARCAIGQRSEIGRLREF